MGKEILEFNEMRKELEEILEELKVTNDTFIFSGLSQSPNGVYMSINGIDSSVDRSIQNRVIFHKGENVAKTCDICPYRLKCLFSEDLPCEEDEMERKKINGLFYERFSGTYEKEKVIEVLKNRGFAPFGMGYGNIQLDNVYEKRKMFVFI